MHNPRIYDNPRNIDNNSLKGIYDRIQHEKPTTPIIAGNVNTMSSLFWENDIETFFLCIFVQGR